MFVHELLRNAHDSIQLRRVHEPEPAGEIYIDMDERTRTLSLSDNDAERRDIAEFLNAIGSTGTGDRERPTAGQSEHGAPRRAARRCFR